MREKEFSFGDYVMRVILKKTAPTAYGNTGEVRDVSNEHGKFLVAKNHATFVKNLPKMTGVNKPFRFGDRLMYGRRKVLFIYSMASSLYVIFEDTFAGDYVPLGKIKRGWKK
jgi:hypothetical protein